MTVVQCTVLCPTNDALADKKAELYDQLQSVVNRQRNKGITLLMGDLNEKIGAQRYGKVMGLEGLMKTKNCLQISVHKTV